MKLLAAFCLLGISFVFARQEENAIVGLAGVYSREDGVKQELVFSHCMQIRCCALSTRAHLKRQKMTPGSISGEATKEANQYCYHSQPGAKPFVADLKRRVSVRGALSQAGVTDRGEQGGLLGMQEVEVAAEQAGDLSQGVRGGFAHGQQAADVGRQGIEVALAGLKFHQLGKRGLVERVDLDGAGEDGPGLRAFLEPDEAGGHGLEIVGAEIGPAKEVVEVELGFVGPAQPEEGDGAQAVEHRGGGAGVGPWLPGQCLQDGQTLLVFAGGQVRLRQHEFRGLGRPFLAQKAVADEA